MLQTTFMPQRNSDVPVQPSNAGPNVVPSSGECLYYSHSMNHFLVNEPCFSSHWLEILTLNAGHCFSSFVFYLLPNLWIHRAALCQKYVTVTPCLEWSCKIHSSVSPIWLVKCFKLHRRTVLSHLQYLVLISFFVAYFCNVCNALIALLSCRHQYFMNLPAHLGCHRLRTVKRVLFLSDRNVHSGCCQHWSP